MTSKKLTNAYHWMAERKKEICEDRDEDLKKNIALAINENYPPIRKKASRLLKATAMTMLILNGITAGVTEYEMRKSNGFDSCRGLEYFYSSPDNEDPIYNKLEDIIFDVSESKLLYPIYGIGKDAVCWVEDKLDEE